MLLSFASNPTHEPTLDDIDPGIDSVTLAEIALDTLEANLEDGTLTPAELAIIGGF